MYPTLDHFCKTHSIPLFRKGDWRLASQSTGEINGLPNSRGRIAATNGILCYIVREDESLFLGHIAFFVEDKEEKAASVKVKEKNIELLFDGMFNEPL